MSANGEKCLHLPDELELGECMVSDAIFTVTVTFIDPPVFNILASPSTVPRPSTVPEVEVVDWLKLLMPVLNVCVICIDSLLAIKDSQVDFVQNMVNASRMLHCSNFFSRPKTI